MSRSSGSGRSTSRDLFHRIIGERRSAVSTGEPEDAAQEHFEVRPPLPVLVIDGERFEDFDGFVSHFSSLLDDFEWRGSLDAFNDILRGGCGTPVGGFELRWLHSERSRDALGWPATIRWLENTIARCHPSHVPRLTAELHAAKNGRGATLFDWLVEIIEGHGPARAEAEGNVVLHLL